jgi:ribonuclease HII
MLNRSFFAGIVEAGCDEAGRGCLAGPVFAAAVILGWDFENKEIDDSKKLTEMKRDRLRRTIEKEAMAWSVASVDNLEIDRVNILNASILAMHKAIAGLQLKPEMLLIDGNKFKPYGEIPHKCIIKGDAKFMSIAAASILAKTHRDEYMIGLASRYPEYGWETNKGYPTLLHRMAIARLGLTPFHRLSYSMQLSLW